jgi:hypothetical protein
MAKTMRLSAVYVLAIALLGASAGAAVAEANPSGPKFFRPHANAPATIVPPNRATISGTNASRLGSGPAKLGGPAKPASGINGTTIRPKH